MVWQMSDDPVQEFAIALECLQNRSQLNNYVVLTATPALYARRFIANNIVDMSTIDSMKAIGQIQWIFSGFKTKKSSLDGVFFCSDLHFNHANIVKYCNRPWNSGIGEDGQLVVTEDDVHQMDDALVQNWNSVVGHDDIVWCLGDFCLGRDQASTIPEFVNKLNGRINLVLGNHDHHSVKFYYDAGFSKVYDRPVVWNDFYILSHAPLQWIKNDMVFMNLHGHVHNQEMYKHVTANTYNCCVEVNNYKPVAFLEIKKKMEACQNGRQRRLL